MNKYVYQWTVKNGRSGLVVIIAPNSEVAEREFSNHMHLRDLKFDRLDVDCEPLNPLEATVVSEVEY